MFELLDGSPGVRVADEAYDDDLAGREYAVDGFDSWKLERRQHFREPWDPSWVAFARGDWDEALRLIEAERDVLKERARLSAAHRSSLVRVRVVERPIGPYLRWELRALRVSTEYGELVRVVGPERIRRWERHGPLPELLTVGPDTVYEIVYDETGLADGAIRHVDRAVRDRVAAFIEGLYHQGEDLADFFDREVAHLVPPGDE